MTLATWAQRPTCLSGKHTFQHLLGSLGSAVDKQLLPGHGAPEQVALQGVAAQLGQQVPLLRGFHPSATMRISRA